jgi:uncharacterized protein YggU (UPF0235/DUF167 family)
MPFWRVGPQGVSVSVKVHPGARRPAVLGQVPDIAGTRLKIAVAEPPEDGRANRAVCAAVADLLGIPPASVSVIQGAAARQKTLLVTGDPATLTARLAAL